MLRRYAGAKALFAFTRNPQPITQARCRPAARVAETRSSLNRSLEIEILGIRRLQIAPEVTAAQQDHQSTDNAGEAH